MKLDLIWVNPTEWEGGPGMCSLNSLRPRERGEDREARVGAGAGVVCGGRSVSGCGVRAGDAWGCRSERATVQYLWAKMAHLNRKKVLTAGQPCPPLRVP